MNGVFLFGTDAVYEAARRLFELIREVMAMEADYPDSLQEAKLIKAEEQLVETMRLETSPRTSAHLNADGT